MDLNDSTAILTARPVHVPPQRMAEFDIFHTVGAHADAQAAFHKFQGENPDIFWTPFNGGHWVATRAQDVETILRDSTTFSSDRIFLPIDNSAPRSLPIETDAPRHTQLRKPLSRALFPKVIDEMEPRITQLVDELIDSFIDRGRCEFVAEFANIMPMNIFLDLVDLPREDRHVLIPLAEKFIKGGTLEIRREAQAAIFKYLAEIVTVRRNNPGSDLGSIVVNCEVDGQRISEQDATAYMTLVLFGGLDTVAATLSYMTYFLARSPDHRAYLLDHLHDDQALRAAIEEMFRRFSIVQAARIVGRDTVYKDVEFRRGDTILPMTILYGLDPDQVSNPLEIDFSRPAPARHLAFGAGPHSCPGSTLARREILIFLKRWLARIPQFSVREGFVPFNITGLTCSLEKLELVWAE